MNDPKRSRVMFVDDEPAVLDSIQANLRRIYAVEIAHGGVEALAAIARDGAPSVVVSDMRMPGMDGAAFLHQVRLVAPDTTRILLTGQAGLESAIAAVNEGQIFRFLTKPCPLEVLKSAVDAGVRQHALISSERVLLEQTLHGSIKALVDILSLMNPVSFGRASRIKQHAIDMADALALKDRWQLEVAAMLSQIGTIVLPASVTEKVYYSRPLSKEEELMLARVPEVTAQLIGNIPRLEVVQCMLAAQAKPFRKPAGTPTSDEQLISRGTEILRIASDFDLLEAQGNTAAIAVEMLRARIQRYDPEVLEVFARRHTTGDGEVTSTCCELPLADLRAGMVLSEDVLMTNGMLLCARGYEVTGSFVERIRNTSPTVARKLIRVMLPRQQDAA